MERKEERMITILMRVDKPQTIYFNPPILRVEKIQLIEVWTRFNSYLVFCDSIDSQYSLTNFDSSENFKPSKLIGFFPRRESSIPFPINKSVMSNLTLLFKETDMTTPTKADTAILNLKIIHE